MGVVKESPYSLKERKVCMENDNKVDLTYVAARLMRIADAKDKDLRKKVEEFQEECLRNIGVNSVNRFSYLSL